MLLILDLSFPLPTSRIQGGFSLVVADRHGEPLRVYGNAQREWRLRCRVKEVSAPLRRSILACEDRWFYLHPGVNPFSVVRAAWTNHRAGRVVCGGSTITMQVARLLEPKPRRYLNKIREVLRALQLEAHYSKDEILEMYLNLAPYGGNLVGARTAAWTYFLKPVSRVSYAEAALLTVIPKAPNQLRPDRFPDRARRARDRALTRLSRAGVIPAADLRLALDETLWMGERVTIREAPHFCDWVRRQSSRETDVVSSLDRGLQTTCEKLTETHLRSLASQHIRQSAVVVMDNMTGEIRAMVGSRNYDDVESEGQVNGALASRSPGSTLKPFMYALAMDRGMLTPRSLLEDVPASYDGYQPSNFDGAFSGVVKARDALARSLNVPAVVLNQRLGPDGLYTLLVRSRVRGLNPDPFYYGLPIVLGACETSLVELCELYACLARGGSFQKASFVAGRPEEPLDRFFSTGASYLVSDILCDVQRPDFPENWQDRTNAPKIAWKTGTSYGYKDAWSVGYNSKYTVGVWVGNFNGAGDHDLVGSRAAAPLLFAVFQTLEASDPGDWFRCPEDVGTRLVCALSGDCPGEDCPETVQDYFIKNVSSVQPCGLHQSRWVDALTERLLCDACRPGREARRRTFEIWPAHVATWLKKADYPLPVLPPHYAGCQRLEDGSGPRIHSPEHLSQYSLRPGIPRVEQKIALIASSYSNVRKVYWLVDGRLEGSGAPQEKFFYVPAPGKHRVVCMDDSGRSSISDITILQ